MRNEHGAIQTHKVARSRIYWIQQFPCSNRYLYSEQTKRSHGLSYIAYYVRRASDLVRLPHSIAWQPQYTKDAVLPGFIHTIPYPRDYEVLNVVGDYPIASRSTRSTRGTRSSLLLYI